MTTPTLSTKPIDQANQRFFQTQNLYEASFLLCQGCNLAGKKDAGRKMVILFKDSVKVKRESLSFYNGGTVEAKKLFDCYRTLKDFIFQR